MENVCIYKYHDTWPAIGMTVLITSTFLVYFGMNVYIFSFSLHLTLEVLKGTSIVQYLSMTTSKGLGIHLEKRINMSSAISNIVASC